MCVSQRLSLTDRNQTAADPPGHHRHAGDNGWVGALHRDPMQSGQNAYNYAGKILTWISSSFAELTSTERSTRRTGRNGFFGSFFVPTPGKRFTGNFSIGTNFSLIVSHPSE